MPCCMGHHSGLFFWMWKVLDLGVIESCGWLDWIIFITISSVTAHLTCPIYATQPIALLAAVHNSDTIIMPNESADKCMHHHHHHSCHLLPYPTHLICTMQPVALQVAVHNSNTIIMLNTSTNEHTHHHPHHLLHYCPPCSPYATCSAVSGNKFPLSYSFTLYLYSAFNSEAEWSVTTCSFPQHQEISAM